MDNNKHLRRKIKDNIIFEEKKLGLECLYKSPNCGLMMISSTTADGPS